MSNPSNLITNRPTYVVQAQPDLISKSKNIEVAEIYYHLDIYCQGMPVIVKRLYIEQMKEAIKSFENGPCDVNFYFLVKNLDSPPYFLLLLLTKFNKCENKVFLHTLNTDFRKSREFVSNLVEKTEFRKEKIYLCVEKKEENNYSIKYFFRYFIKYAEKTNNNYFKELSYLLGTEVFLSIPDLYRSSYFDLSLLKIDAQRMAEKGYFYHVFSTNDIFDVFRSQKFHEFANSSAPQAQFNFILGLNEGGAVSIQKKDGKLSFISFSPDFNKSILILRHLEDYINENKGNIKKELPSILMDTSNIKIYNFALGTKADFNGGKIFHRDLMINLLKDPEYLNEFHEAGEYGNSYVINTDTEVSVTHYVKPGLVRFCQSSWTRDKYKEAFDERGLSDVNVRKNKLNKPQTFEQYQFQHPGNKKDEINNGVFDERRKLTLANRRYLSIKLNIYNETLPSFLMELLNTGNPPPCDSKMILASGF